MKNYYLLTLALAGTLISACQPITKEECMLKYNLIPMDSCPPAACDLGAITTMPPDGTPLNYFKADETYAAKLKTDYNASASLLTEITVSKNTLNYLLCTMDADTVSFNFAKDSSGIDTFIITYVNHSGAVGWIYHNPMSFTYKKTNRPPYL